MIIRNLLLLAAQPSWRQQNQRWFIMLMVILVQACSAGASPITSSFPSSSITWQELPTGVGRGFPLLSIDHVDAQSPLQVGKAAPNLMLTLEDGRSLTLGDLRGQPVVLNFWASWCGPCRLEMPDIVKQAQQHPEIAFIAINVQELLADIHPFADEFAMHLLIARDAEGAVRDRYQVRGMPTTVFLDRDGNVFTIWAGMVSTSLLAEILADIG